jgi:hypothetical protein
VHPELTTRTRWWWVVLWIVLLVPVTVIVAVMVPTDLAGRVFLIVASLALWIWVFAGLRRRGAGPVERSVGSDGEPPV